MKCSQCQTEIADDKAFCPICGQSLPTAEPDDSSSSKPEVLEPELLNGHEQSCQQRPDSSYQQILYTNFTHPVSSGGCLPFVATFILAGVAAASYGFLAGLGFLFFSFLGFALTFFLAIKLLLRGKTISVLLTSLAIWLISWSLTAWLSRGMG